MYILLLFKAKSAALTAILLIKIQY